LFERREDMFNERKAELPLGPGPHFLCLWIAGDGETRLCDTEGRALRAITLDRIIKLLAATAQRDEADRQERFRTVFVPEGEAGI
jgi:hypothetical protein